MLLANVATILAVLAASAGSLVGAVPVASTGAGQHERWSTRAHTAPRHAQADVRSPPGTPTDIRVRVELEGFLDGMPTSIAVQADSGLFEDSAVLGPGHFLYHIHTHFISSDGNCSSALGHLDPQQVNDSLVCDPAFPQYCQIGDLSGKHGRLNGTATGAIERFRYNDAFVRWFPHEFSLLGRSIVVHAQNGTRIACGNITSPLDGTADPSTLKPTFAPSTYNPPSTLPTTSFPLPGPPITPINGTIFPSDACLASLPYPWPHPALTLAQALNVELVVEETKFGDLLPVGIPSDAPPPFCDGDEGKR